MDDCVPNLAADSFADVSRATVSDVAGPAEAVPGHAGTGVPVSCCDVGCVEAVARNDRWVGPFCSVQQDGRVHFHHVDLLHARVAAAQQAEFVQVCARFDTDPDDFVNAWKYLCSHPLFHRPVMSGSSDRVLADLSVEEFAELASPAFVETDDGLRDLWMLVNRDDGGVEVWLEHGPHLWPADVGEDQYWLFPVNGQSSHDPDLDVTSATYELAVVALAGRVAAKYGHDRSRVRRFGCSRSTGMPDSEQLSG